MAIFDPKTKAIAGYQKQIDEKKRTITKYYDEIGRLYYELYKDMSVDVTKEINARCESVTTLYKEIKDLEEKILFEKGLKLCPNCGKENQLAYAFCFGCGTKFVTDEPKVEEPAAPAVPATENVPEPVVEKVETTEESDSKEDSKEEKAAEEKPVEA